MIPARAELTRDGALDVLIDVSLYQTKCYGYASPSAKAALNRLGDIFNIKLPNSILKLSNETDARESHWSHGEEKP